MDGVKLKINRLLLPTKVLYRVETRVKDIKKVFNKVEKRGYLNDYYGARVIYDGKETLAYELCDILSNEFETRWVRDYIRFPKTNGYKSLHLICYWDEVWPLEIQIRNQEMDFVAKKGSARII
jgi:(p)ppGpp synthase/HD superfamily hydrolase